MDSTIVSSIISAISSILIAIIGKNVSEGKTNSGGVITIPKRNNKYWFICTFVLVCWMIFATLFLHWDIAGASVLLIPIIILIMSAVFPIKPTSAAAISLFLFPFAFVAEPIGKLRQNMNFYNHFEPKVIGFFVSLAFGTAFFAWLITRFRARSYRSSLQEDPKTPHNSLLALQLSEIATLHEKGILSDEEFTKAKKKIISE